MRPGLTAVAVAALLTAAPVAAEDLADAKDHPLFTRMPGFSLVRQEVKEFEVFTFRAAGGKEVAVEGKYMRTLYEKGPSTTEPSRVQIHRNYENAIKKLGGKATFNDGEGNAYLQLTKDGREFYIQVDAYLTWQYTVTIVEKADMEQAVEANAAFFTTGLKTTGHVAVYGILFDTGKSVVKPESEPALVEIAKLLKAEPGLKLYVVGHTDNVGKLEPNMKLSQARAEAVVAALLSRHGVAPGRLIGTGIAQLSPVASNDDDAGRAKNRRVELVKQ